MLRNLFSVAGANSASRILRFVYLIAISRFLPADEVGLFLYGFAFYLGFLPLAMFGQPQLLAARLGRSRAELSRIVGHSLSVQAGLALTAGATAVVLAVMTETAEHLDLLLVFILALLARAVVHWARAVFVALEDATWIPRYEIAFRVGEAVAGIAALALGAGLLAICVLHFAFFLLEAAATVQLLATRGGLSLTFGKDRRLLRRMVVMAFPIAVGLFLVQLFAQIGIILMRHVEPDLSVVAQLGFAMQFVTALLILPQAFGSIFLPAVSRGFRRGGRQIMALRLSVRLSLLAGTVVALLAAAYAPSLVTHTAGADYGDAGTALRILAWSIGPYSATIILTTVLNAMNGRREVALVGLLIVVLHVAGFFLLLPLGSLTAASLSFLLASVLGGGASCLAVQRRTGAGGASWWFVPLSISAAGAFLSLVLPESASLALAALVVLAMWRTRLLSDEERDLLAEKLLFKLQGRHGLEGTGD